MDVSEVGAPLHRYDAENAVLRAALRVLQSEYAEPSAHSGDDAEYASDQLLEAARGLVAARSADNAAVGGRFDLDLNEPRTSALVLILGGGCERYTAGSCIQAGKLRGGPDYESSWCDACVAADALAVSSERDKVGRFV